MEMSDERDIQTLMADYALNSMIANLMMLKGLPIGGSPERLDLFERMIDTLMDNPYIMTAIRMKQHPEEYE